MNVTLTRPDLLDLTPAEIAPIEELLTDVYPDTWKELARSAFVTLRALDPEQPAEQAAAAALAIARGIGQDMGGSQPYIPVGHFFEADAKALRVVEGFNGNNYRELAAREKITESRVRQILAAWRREQFEKRQGSLTLD